ncbi:MAG: hypothetical protein IMZ46_10015 [Acidobacteria bacterium]|nr:hypothetical protein [Acidobacteriota bacterium]
MDLVDDLVLTPFKEIVDQAATAVGNAGDNPEMLKASHALLKEGQRALKKLDPLCRKQFDDYGTAFTDALKGNGKRASLGLPRSHLHARRDGELTVVPQTNWRSTATSSTTIYGNLTTSSRPTSSTRSSSPSCRSSRARPPRASMTSSCA